MKTLSFVNDEIDRILKDGHSGQLSASKAGKNKRRLKFLNTVKVYLEYSPTEEAVKRQLDHCKHHLDVISSRYPGDESYKKKLGKDFQGNPRTVYNSKHGVGVRKKQITLLNYILQNDQTAAEEEE